MPICPHCNLGVPPSFAECPECGRKLVAVASVAALEEQIDVVEIHSLSEMLVEYLPDDLDAEVPPPNGVLESAETEPEPEIPRLESPDDRPASPPRKSPPKKRARTNPPKESAPSAPIDVQDETPQSVVPAEADDDGSDEDQFVGTGRGFARIHRPAEQEPSASTIPSVRSVRWAHRAYRGEVEMSATGSRASSTLVIFGDGLLLIGSGATGSGFPGAVRGLLSGGSFARKRQKTLGLAGSSGEGQSLVPGSRRLTPADIEMVRIDKGGALHRELTIRTTTEEMLRYRFPAKRHGDVMSLLSRVLGAKLVDAVKATKAARTG